MLAKLFIRWLEENQAAVRSWADVAPKTIRDCLAHCQRELRLSNDQVRKRLYAVKMTSRYMAPTYEEAFGDVGATVRFVPRRVNPLEQKTKKARKALAASDLRTFLSFLEKRRADFHEIAGLQGLAGLRALEAVHLRQQDIDFRTGLVTATDTPRHRPKNLASYRTIPVVRPVLETIRNVQMNLKDPHEEGYLFLASPRQRPFSVWSYSHIMRRELASCWKETGIDQFRGSQPRWLRATFVTGALRHGADPRMLHRYVGLTAPDILGSHYEIVSPEQLRAEALPATGEFWHESATVEPVRV